jgi:hypothetical protein
MARKRTRPVTSAARYRALNLQERETYRRVREAASEFREGELSLRQVARKHGTTKETMEHYLGVDFPRQRGRLRPIGDRAGAFLHVLGTDGPRELFVTGSRQRERLGDHWSAMARLPDDGGDSLERLGELTVSGLDVDNGRRMTVVLETDPDAVEFWQQREPDFFLELYGETTM